MENTPAPGLARGSRLGRRGVGAADEGGKGVLFHLGFYPMLPAALGGGRRPATPAAIPGLAFRTVRAARSRFGARGGAHRLLGVLDFGMPQPALGPCLGPQCFGEKKVPPRGCHFRRGEAAPLLLAWRALRASPQIVRPPCVLAKLHGRIPPRPPWHCRAFWGGASLGEGGPAASPEAGGIRLDRTAGREVRRTPRGARARAFPGVLSSHPILAPFGRSHLRKWGPRTQL